jgi:hypothetical protein
VTTHTEDCEGCGDDMNELPMDPAMDELLGEADLEGALTAGAFESLLAAEQGALLADDLMASEVLDEDLMLFEEFESALLGDTEAELALALELAGDVPILLEEEAVPPAETVSVGDLVDLLGRYPGLKVTLSM